MARTKQIRHEIHSLPDKMKDKMKDEIAAQLSSAEGKYPGLGLPVRWMPQYGIRHDRPTHYSFPIGAHPSCTGAGSDILLVREIAMMSVMEQLSDKPDWHSKVFNDDIVAKWKQEALAVPDDHWWRLAIREKQSLAIHTRYSSQGKETRPIEEMHDDWIDRDISGILSEQSFDYCIEELQHKAKHFERTGIVPTLDASASIAKSDTLVTPELHERLRDAFQKLKADHASSPDWHPNSNEMVQDLVHPSMYPLIYDRTRVYGEEVVGITDAIEKWAGKGNVIPKDNSTSDERSLDSYWFGQGGVGDFMSRDYWSDAYQWLPANVAFQEGGGVKFTSYINNLHPTRHKDTYHALEKLVETSLPMWDQCLSLIVGRDETRLSAGRKESRFPVDDPSDSNPENWIPSDPEQCSNDQVNMEEFRDEFGYGTDEEKENEDAAEELKQWRWEQLRKPRVPEPKSAGYAVGYMPKEGSRLVDLFRESGLQIIVKITSIELTPEKPSFPAGGWHIEGMMNEHICATALYYLDSENVTSSSLSFRMHTDRDIDQDGEFSVGQDEYHWMQYVYAANFGVGNGSSALQNYGSVETKQGRLIAFPNVFHHRVSGFELADPSKRGHRRFIALWLVDPTRRIISTANVPPQQMSWWAESAFGSSSEARKEAISKMPGDIVDLMNENGITADTTNATRVLPEELVEMVRENVKESGPLPLSVEEAKGHRLKLMEERSAFHRTSDGNWHKHSYSFCEH